MSGKVITAFNVANMLLMEDTLKRLGHQCSKTKEGLSIARAYYNIDIKANEITCDSMNTSEVEKIKAEYQRDYQLRERALRGETFEVTETSNEIVIMVH
jgi:hypothetical protein